MPVYVLVAIVKKPLALDASLYTSPQILPAIFFEKMPLRQAFPGRDSNFYSITIAINESVLVLTGQQYARIFTYSDYL